MDNIDESSELILASTYGESDKVQLLLNNGADPNIQDERKNTALMYASSNGYEDIVELLLEAGADPNIYMEGSHKHTALMEASAIGYIAIVRLLLYYGADPSLKNKNGETAFTHASSYEHPEIEQLLLEARKKSQYI